MGVENKNYTTQELDDFLSKYSIKIDDKYKTVNRTEGPDKNSDELDDGLQEPEEIE